MFGGGWRRWLPPQRIKRPYDFNSLTVFKTPGWLQSAFFRTKVIGTLVECLSGHDKSI